MTEGTKRQETSKAKVLLDALKYLQRHYVGQLENARDRIVSLGGQCDSVETMERGDPHLRQVREVIASVEATPDETLAPRQVTLSGYALKAALEFSAPDMTPEQLETEVNIQWGDAGHSGSGYYACIAEYPEEGSIMLPEGAEPPEHDDLNCGQCARGIPHTPKANSCCTGCNSTPCVCVELANSQSEGENRG